MKRFLLFFVAALLFVACDNKFEDEGNTIQRVSSLPTLTAEFADEDTRTYVEDNFYLRWHEGDLISAFVGNTRNSKYMFEGNTGDNSGTFGSTDSSLGSSDKLDRNYALYPYDKSVNISVNGVISCSLPAVQEYAEESFGKGANTMVAVTKSTDDTFLAFKNACGYLKVKLYGKATVKNIELKGNNGEKIAGEASITATYGGAPTAAMAEDATESITLDCGEGVKLSTDAENPTEFWVVVPATEFSKGLTIVATDTNGVTFVKSTSNAVTITRNEIQPMAALEAIFRDQNKPAYNEIWYTSSDGKIVEPNKTNVFGANIVSNKYNDGKGVITFDGNVTTIGKGAFYSCTSLTSVTIPDSVIAIGGLAFQDCSSLTNVTIPNSVTTIEDQTFYYCESLTSVTIGDSVTTIGANAFSHCTSLTSLTIPNGVIEIQGWAFYGCTSLTSVIIPESITCIHYFAFSNCENLVSIYCKSVYPPNLVYLSQDGLRYWNAFDNNAIDRKIYVPQGSGEYYRVNDGWNLYAEDIVEYDFTTENESSDDAANSEIWYTSTDGNIVEPNKTNVFGANIISNIYKDGKGVITFNGNVTMIGVRAFTSCDNLKSITIPDGVKTIEVYAFSECPNLKNVTIPDSVTSILGVAFGWCSSLASITIPNRVSIIGEAAFYECNSLKKVYCMPTTPPTSDYGFQWSAFDNNATGRKIYVPRGCGEAYRSAAGWSDYASDIVEYDF